MTRHQFISRTLAFCPLLGFFWGLAEGTFFFVVPDVLISLVAVFSLQRLLPCLAASLLGSLAAGVIVYEAAAWRPAVTEAFVRQVPFATAKMFQTVNAGLAQDGWWALVKAPVSGIPYKIYSCLAPPRVDFLPFLLTSIPARGLRFAAVGGIAGLAGVLARRKGPSWEEKLPLIHAGCWNLFYAFYWFNVLNNK